MPRSAPARGLTLIELAVAVVVVGVLASTALPGMREFIDKQRLVGQMRAVANLAQIARSEAIAHSAGGAPGSKTVAMTISPGAPWFVGLANGNAACSGSSCVINDGGNMVAHTVTATECPACTLVAPTITKLVVFDLRGLVVAGADQTVTLQSPLGKKLSLTVSRLGRISTCTPAGSLAGYPTC